MRTDDLITALAADTSYRGLSVERSLALALMAGALVTGALFFAVLGFRPDIVQALHTVRFPFKFVVTLSLLAAALFVLPRLLRPGANVSRAARSGLLVAPILLAAAVGLELTTVPSALWGTRLVGVNWWHCLVAIPLLALAPLGALLAAARHGAALAPRVTGALAGLAAAALAATFYASNCTDDSPLFVVTWYTLACAAVTALGAALGPRVLRW
jgi:hypothetical protein